MRPDLQRRIQRYGWDNAAPWYESGWQKQLWPAQERLLSQAKLEPGATVLDVSCGSGLVTIPIAEQVAPGGTVMAVDLSEGMIEKARSRIEEQQIHNVTFRRMDAEALDLADNSYDVVVCSLGLMYFSDPEKALKEMFRVLVPGGRAVALVWGERRQCGWAGIFPIVDRRVKSDVCPLFFQLGMENALQSVFKTAGFAEVSSGRFSSILHYETDEEACIAAFLGGAVALAYQKFDEKVRKEVQQEYLASISQYRNGTGYDVPGEFVTSVGFKK